MESISDEKKLKKVLVFQKGDKYYFPKTIPKERKSATEAYVLMLILIFVVHLVLSDCRSCVPSFYTSACIIHFVTCLIYRFIIFLYELGHSCSRYGNDNIEILKRAFYFDYKVYCLVTPCTFHMVYYLSNYGLPTLEDKLWFCVIPFIFLLHRIIDLEEFPIKDSLWIAKHTGLDYGSGMAYSFFYGYLNYMLNKIGDPGKNLHDMMKEYESANRVRFAVYKIFILIPKSLTCFESVKNGSTLMEMRSTLLEKKITIAGIRERIYKHAVYSIKPDPELDGHVYVCCEFATPLKTFKEVLERSTPHTEFYKQHKNDILLQFYVTLKAILKMNKVDAMCELVYYEEAQLAGHLDAMKILVK
ncbi:stimulator of interferon genes protein homolog isoform X2 [Dendroctonus ponderosae]|uniref:STING ligand-binding domain-containing protein n=1 Tax=Dendroctonus ponderosae TaxID=77166 RepID=A0AAR5PNX3_DENPD|nr:stimulator of interferon genes protein homolog isoform X2 [Dendroctonus ponderosae]